MFLQTTPETVSSRASVEAGRPIRNHCSSGNKWWWLGLGLGRNSQTYIYIFFLKLFIYLRLAVLCSFSLVVASGSHPLLQFALFSMRWFLSLQTMGMLDFSTCGSWASDHRISSWDTWAQLFHGVWDLPGSRIKPVSPALAGRFFTTEPSEKPQTSSKGVVAL